MEKKLSPYAPISINKSNIHCFVTATEKISIK